LGGVDFGYPTLQNSVERNADDQSTVQSPILSGRGVSKIDHDYEFLDRTKTEEDEGVNTINIWTKVTAIKHTHIGH